MIHLNGNLLCAVDIETTGFDPDKQEIYEFAIIPLGPDLQPHPKYMPLDLLMKPDNKDEIDWDGMKQIGNDQAVVNALLKGSDKYEVAEFFVDWFTNLRLPETKKITPLAMNWGGIDKAFILKWLGPATFNQLFHFHYRDVMTTALYINDRADHHNERIPFPKVGLNYLCSQLKIERHGRSHGALDDAMTTAHVYRRLLGQIQYGLSNEVMD